MFSVFKIVFNVIKIIFQRLLNKTTTEVDDDTEYIDNPQQIIEDWEDVDDSESLEIYDDGDGQNIELDEVYLDADVDDTIISNPEGEIVQMLENGKKYSKLPEEYLNKLLIYEGGLVDDPVDKGGKTNRGITEATLRAAIQQGLVPKTVTIESLTYDLESVRKIYEHNYYLRAKCHHMPHPVAFAHFDASVHHGIGNSSRFIQRTLNVFGAKLDVDGAIGPLTLTALNSITEKVDLLLIVKVYCDIRKSFCDAIVRNYPEQQKFYKGWINRINDVLKFCGVIQNG